MSKIKYIILAQPRTGSNNLVDFLKRHPAIQSKGEILYHEEYSFEKKLRRVFRTFANRKYAAGFKLMPRHVDALRLKDEIEKSIGMRNIKIISLNRKDTSEQLISWAVAEKTNIWKLNNRHLFKYETFNSFHIDSNDIDRIFTELRTGEELFEKFCLGIAKEMKLAISFEDSITTTGKKTILDFLGVSYRRVKSFDNCTRSFDTHNEYQTLISNYDEIKAYCRAISN